jgi:hypothetical protein
MAKLNITKVARLTIKTNSVEKDLKVAIVSGVKVQIVNDVKALIASDVKAPIVNDVKAQTVRNVKVQITIDGRAQTVRNVKALIANDTEVRNMKNAKPYANQENLQKKSHKTSTSIQKMKKTGIRHCHPMIWTQKRLKAEAVIVKDMTIAKTIQNRAKKMETVRIRSEADQDHAIDVQRTSNQEEEVHLLIAVVVAVIENTRQRRKNGIIQRSMSQRSIHKTTKQGRSTCFSLFFEILQTEIYYLQYNLIVYYILFTEIYTCIHIYTTSQVLTI